MIAQQQYELLPRDSNDLFRPAQEDRPRKKRRGPLILFLTVPFRLLRYIFRFQILKKILLWTSLLLFCLLTFTYYFNPSYSRPPPYTIPKNARVFIASNIVDSDYQTGSHDGLVQGAWGDALIALTQLLASHDIPVHISVYGGHKNAMTTLNERLNGISVPRTIVSEEASPIDLSTIPHIDIPSGKYKGQARIKRVAYLAAVRNKALEPLSLETERYTHVMFINDVVFSAENAMRLLFGTNAVPDAPPGLPLSGREENHHTQQDERNILQPFPNYRAACALDFITSWKFYDSFASRDFDGYGIGVPIFPWFGNGVTRNDLLSRKELARVKACWGGMIAFDARFFQGALPSRASEKNVQIHSKLPTLDANTTANIAEDTAAWNTWAKSVLPAPRASTLPLLFRAEPHPFWSASECCLVHADIAAPTPATHAAKGEEEDSSSLGIFINPYVRVAYTTSAFRHLPFYQRLERLFIYPQRLLNYLSSMPKRNVLRTEAGSRTYKPDEAVFGNVDFRERKTSDVVDGFCMVRQLLLLREGELQPGERNWENVGEVVPPV